MHQPIRDNLEKYLKGPAQQVSQEFQAHLKACGECAEELRLFESQAEMLRSLRTDGDMAPRAGFYARVMDRIEQQRPSSIWAILLEPSIGRRLAMASATLVVLLGTYLVTTEANEPQVAAGNQEIVLTGAPMETPAPAQDNLRQQRARDAVLVNLAAYRQ
jgi:predicted anti-sigma-YlaC factor YlaD